MNLPEYVDSYVRGVLERERTAIEDERAACLRRMAQAREAGAHRRVDAENRSLEALTHRAAVVHRIGTDPRMQSVFEHFAKVDNLLNTPIWAFVEDVVRACRDFDAEQHVVDYRENLFSEVSETATRLEALLREVNLDPAIDGQFEGAEALQGILRQVVQHRTLAREAAIPTYAAKASRKASRKWEALRGVLFAMSTRGFSIPQWTDGFFNVLAITMSVATGEDVSRDDACKAFKQVQKILLEDNT